MMLLFFSLFYISFSFIYLFRVTKKKREKGARMGWIITLIRRDKEYFFIFMFPTRGRARNMRPRDANLNLGHGLNVARLDAFMPGTTTL
jgi:hypothetical protein